MSGFADAQRARPRVVSRNRDRRSDAHRARGYQAADTDAQQHLGAFVAPRGPLNIDRIAHEVVQNGAIQEIADKWRLPPNLAVDLCQIALFNVVMLVDDSGSMHAEKGERINDVSA